MSRKLEAIKDEFKKFLGQTLERDLPLTPFQENLMMTLSDRSGVAIVQDKGTAAIILGPRLDNSHGVFASRDKNPQYGVDVIAMNTEVNKPYWYSVLFHELGHATGTRQRLCRMGITGMIYNPVIYAIEEVLAESVAMRIMENLGLATCETRELSVKYIMAYDKVITRHVAHVDVIELDYEIEKAEALVMQWLQGIEFKAA